MNGKNYDFDFLKKKASEIFKNETYGTNIGQICLLLDNDKVHIVKIGGENTFEIIHTFPEKITLDKS